MPESTCNLAVSSHKHTLARKVLALDCLVMTASLPLPTSRFLSQSQTAGCNSAFKAGIDNDDSQMLAKTLSATLLQNKVQQEEPAGLSGTTSFWL